MAKARSKTPAAKTAPAKASAAEKTKAVARPAGIRKKYLKARPACQVTFVLPKDAAPDAESVCVLGEFNDWSQDANPLRRLKDGDFTVTLELETGRSYRFRYVIDGWKYENDWYADRYEPNPYGGEDSVVDV
ncbi:MAG TPA: isoamylase early set domain-containing protein [bacterium]